MNFWKMGKAYLWQWFHGIEIVEIVPGLYQSSAIRWPWDKAKVKALGIRAVIDLSGGFDPHMDWLADENGAYLYWPIKDEAKLPNLRVLDDVATWGMRMWDANWRVLVHCTAGFNRSGLVNAMILYKTGISGKGDALLNFIRKKRPGALSNQTFADYVATLPGVEAPTSWKGGRSRGKKY